MGSGDRYKFLELTGRSSERFLGRSVTVLLLAALVGAAGGLAASGVIRLAGYIAQLVSEPSPWRFVAPAAGGLVAGLSLFFLARGARGRGLPEVMHAAAHDGGRLPLRAAFVESLASAVAVGSGCAAGREGPAMQAGAGLGSLVGRAFGLSGDRVVALLGCGAAAGFAATFDAPIAGALLAIEVVIGSASIRVFSPIAVASIAAAIVSRAVLGERFLPPLPTCNLANPTVELPLYAALGAAAGLLGAALTKGISLVEEGAERARIPAWLGPALGGVAVGGIAAFHPEVLGGGGDAMRAAIGGQIPPLALAALALLGVVAAAFTIGSGAAGGVFTPALFAGACLGGAFGAGAEHLAPAAIAGPGGYAIVGMGAVLAATGHAPITAIVLVLELTADPAVAVPLMLACIVAATVSSRALSTSVFTTRLARRGVRLRLSLEAELMRTTKVRRILRPFVETLPPTAGVGEVLSRALHGPSPYLYVVDAARRPVGAISLHHVKSIVGESGLDEARLVAADVMQTPVTVVSLDDALETAMRHLSRMDVEALPVVDADGAVAGCVTRHDILVFFETEILRDSALGMTFSDGDRPEETKFIELPEGHAVALIEVTELLAGKTLRELDLRATAGINVIGIRVKGSAGIERLSPEPKRALARGEILVAVGEEKAIEAFRKAVEA